MYDVFFFFIFKLDFYFFDHSETSILSCNPVLPLNFHPTMWKLDWYKDVSFWWRRPSKIVGKRGQGNGRRFRWWDTGESVRWRGTWWQHTYFTIFRAADVSPRSTCDSFPSRDEKLQFTFKYWKCMHHLAVRKESVYTDGEKKQMSKKSKNII